MPCGLRVGTVAAMSATPRTFSNLPSLHESADATTALVVVPWSQFGARRLCVDTTDGRHVGWVNLDTGQRSLAMPDLEPAFENAVSESGDARTPRWALAQAIELALIEGLASQGRTETPPEATVPAGTAPGDHSPDMRHAYRGKKAFSDWDLSPRGTRLVADELDGPASTDPRWAYQHSAPAGRVTEVAHLFG